MRLPVRVLRPLGARLNGTEEASSKDRFKVLVIGAGTAGISVSNQIFNRFKSAGKPLADGDVAVVDAAEWHHYQPGWTLAGAGLKDKTTLRRPLTSLIPQHITHIPSNVQSFEPTKSSITLTSGQTLGYDILIVATGLSINWGGIKGLPQALADPTSGVSSIYSYDTCDKTWKDISALRNGKAVFTQPAGVIKCAGAPQTIMNIAWDFYHRHQLTDTTKLEFWSASQTLFPIPKYSSELTKLHLSRGIHAHFSHNLISIDSSSRLATFKNLISGKEVQTDYTLLHVVPPHSPLPTLKSSPISDEEGWVNVDAQTLQHKNPEYANVFAIGDCSSLPTSKSAAAITAQAPVLSENVFSLLDTGKLSNARYDGYTGCPILTDSAHLILAEFKYNLLPKETFASSGDVDIDQSTPNRLFYYLNKNLFPSIYWKAMVKGIWYGPNAFKRPEYHSNIDT